MKYLSISIFLSLLLFMGACTKSKNVQIDQSSLNSVSATNNEVQNQSMDEVSNNTDNDSSETFDDFDDYDNLGDFDDYDDFDNYDLVEYTDPFMPWNKFWFTFNDILLLKIAKPIHQGYVKIVPTTLRRGLGFFKYNLNAPIRMGNALLQAEFSQFFIEFGRLIINVSTSAGFADVASQNKPFFPHTPKNLRFGYTLAKWNIPQGPYFMIPFYGPSTIRESIGTLGDTAASPPAYLLPIEGRLILGGFLTVNDFGKIYTVYENFKENAFDPYISLRNAYLEQLNYNKPK